MKIERSVYLSNAPLCSHQVLSRNASWKKRNPLVLYKYGVSTLLQASRSRRARYKSSFWKKRMRSAAWTRPASRTWRHTARAHASATRRNSTPSQTSSATARAGRGRSSSAPPSPTWDTQSLRPASQLSSRYSIGGSFLATITADDARGRLELEFFIFSLLDSC